MNIVYGVLVGLGFGVIIGYLRWLHMRLTAIEAKLDKVLAARLEDSDMPA